VLEFERSAAINWSRPGLGLVNNLVQIRHLQLEKSFGISRHFSFYCDKDCSLARQETKTSHLHWNTNLFCKDCTIWHFTSILCQIL